MLIEVSLVERVRRTGTEKEYALVLLPGVPRPNDIVEWSSPGGTDHKFKVESIIWHVVDGHEDGAWVEAKGYELE